MASPLYIHSIKLSSVLSIKLSFNFMGKKTNQVMILIYKLLCISILKLLMPFSSVAGENEW